MRTSTSPLAKALASSPQFHIQSTRHFAGGSLIHCHFDAHEVRFPPLDEVVLLVANTYQLRHALYDFGWGYRDHFSSHPHPMHVFPAHNAFSWNKDGSADILLLTLPAQALLERFTELGYANPSEGLWQLSQKGFSAPLLYQLLTSFLHRTDADYPALLVDSYYTLVVEQLAQNWGRKKAAPASERRLSTAQLQKLIDFIKSHLTSDLNLDVLAQSCGMSKYHFLRCFKASTDKTPLQYITDLRIANAQHLLVSQRMSLQQVAAASGFSSAENMSRVFSKNTGHSPHALRKAVG